MSKLGLGAEHGARTIAVVLVLAAMAIGATPAPAGPIVAELSAAMTPAELTIGAPVSVTGRAMIAGQAQGGVSLTLQQDAYPYHGFAPLAHTTTAPDGSFSFAGIALDRNTRLQVASEGPPPATSPALEVIVDPRVTSHARSLAPGVVGLSLRVRHTHEGGSGSVSVRWFLAARGSRVFRLAAVTSSRELTPGVTYASVRVDPPAKRFVYRVCMNPPWERAMGAAPTHRPCPPDTFVIGPHGG
jgi:hypothetical protein